MTPGLRIIVLVALVGACANDPELRLSSWTLAVGNSPPRDLALPVRLEGIPDGATYRLSTDVDVPPALRDRPLTFTLSQLRAPAVLYADGREAPLVDGDGLAPYRVWRVSGASPRLHLVLAVTNSSFFGTHLGLAPELGADASLRFRVSRAASGTAALVTVILATLMSLIYSVTWLLDRRRTAHGWFALQAILVTPAYAAVFGGTPATGAIVAVMYTCMVAAAVAGVHFVHAEFRLGRVPRVLWGAFALVVVDVGVEANAFAGARHQETALYVIGLPVCVYVIARLIKVARRPGRDRVSATMFAIAWAIFLASAVPDVLIATGNGELVAGVYGSSIGVALYVLVHSLVLARERAVAARRQEELNRELQHQVAERSRELSKALTRLESPREAQLAPGTVVDGRYRIRGSLGEGGMGRVYACERIADGAQFALKVLHGKASPAALARFAREAEIAARLDSAYLIAVRDVGVTAEGVMFLIMDLATGTSLAAERARFGQVAWGLRVLIDVARGLAALHAAGVIHRDLKPSNVLLGNDHARITDFGVSSMRVAPVTGDDATVDAASSLTKTGSIMGTPLYIAPELIRGSRDPKLSSDIYSFGVLAYELLAGRRPVTDMLLRTAPKPLREEAPTAPAAIAALIDRALAAEPATRPTADEILRVLTAAS